MPLTPDELEERIAKARAETAHPGDSEQESASDADNNRALSFGLSAGFQFAGSVVVGGGLGWLIDRWLGTSPFALLGLTILFFVGALANVWLTMTRAVDAATRASGSGKEPG